MLQAEIRVKGRLDESWADWFEGLSIEHTPASETLLRGSVSDAAALYGLLARLRGLNLALVSVNTKEE
jgi:hypothetical protein